MGCGAWAPPTPMGGRAGGGPGGSEDGGPTPVGPPSEGGGGGADGRERSLFGAGIAKKAVALGSASASDLSLSVDSGTISSMPVSSGRRSPTTLRGFFSPPFRAALSAVGENGVARLAGPPTGGRGGAFLPPF